MLGALGRVYCVTAKLLATSEYTNCWTAAWTWAGGAAIFDEGRYDMGEQRDVMHAVGGNAIIIVVESKSDLLTTDRSHEDYGTKLTNVVSKFN
eukprot:scaffold59131_cov39-Cyclotella_meneghiniana.AAC.2